MEVADQQNRASTAGTLHSLLLGHQNGKKFILQVNIFSLTPDTSGFSYHISPFKTGERLIHFLTFFTKVQHLSPVAPDLRLSERCTGGALPCAAKDIGGLSLSRCLTELNLFPRQQHLLVNSASLLRCFLCHMYH